MTRKIYDNILQTLGNTPIVRLNKVGTGAPAILFGKLEMMNPGGSIKDRIGIWMIEDAERRGLIKPGGVIVEGTSGNTGVGLAIAAIQKGYRCIFVLPDKMSQEKINSLRAYGAKVVVTPTAVAPEDPRSYYSVSRRLAQETPNAIYIDQYNNLSNRDCHYRTTGPEILEQLPNIDYLFVGIGTGGTICGVGKYLKEKRPTVKVIAIDPMGSIVYDTFKTGGKNAKAMPYKIEGIGEDFIPKNYDFSVIDDIVQVEDRESFIMTRSLLTQEGIYAGVSSGAAVVGAMKWLKTHARDAETERKNALIILPDSGNRYLSKVFNDAWMQDSGFLESATLGTVADIVAHIHPSEIVFAHPNSTVADVVALMRERGFSQLPVRDASGWIKGVVTETALIQGLANKSLRQTDFIELLVDPSIEFVSADDPAEKILRLLNNGRIPLATDPVEGNKVVAVITKIDLLSFLGQQK